jgi:hypothetical protein
MLHLQHLQRVPVSGVVDALPGTQFTQFTYTDAAAVSAEGEQPTDARGLVTNTDAVVLLQQTLGISLMVQEYKY